MFLRMHVPDNATEAGLWSLVALLQNHNTYIPKAQDPSVCVWRMLQWAGLCFSKTQISRCLHDKALTLTYKHTHAAILIAVSLLQGEKIGYLKASLTHSFPPSPSSTAAAAAFTPCSSSWLCASHSLFPLLLSHYFASPLLYGLTAYRLFPWVCSVCPCSCSFCLRPPFYLSSARKCIGKTMNPEVGDLTCSHVWLKCLSVSKSKH